MSQLFHSTVWQFSCFFLEFKRRNPRIPLNQGQHAQILGGEKEEQKTRSAPQLRQPRAGAGLLAALLLHTPPLLFRASLLLASRRAARETRRGVGFARFLNNLEARCGQKKERRASKLPGTRVGTATKETETQEERLLLPCFLLEFHGFPETVPSPGTQGVS